ncbi:MAG TPA: hypothetical protein PKC69_03950 [Chitinophagaceae bacterium]|nr:hypothetical protein [Chitinophagaceae bacterium]
MHQTYLLDAGGAGLAFLGLIIVIAAIIGVILIEAGIMTLFKYSHFRKALLESFLINLLSLILGYIMLAVIDMEGITNGNKLLQLFYFFLATVILEIPILHFLNNKTRAIKFTVVVGLAINVVSYVLLALLFYLE